MYNIFQAIALTYFSYSSEGIEKGFTFCFFFYNVGSLIPESGKKFSVMVGEGGRNDNKMKCVVKFSKKWNSTPSQPSGTW